MRSARRVCLARTALLAGVLVGALPASVQAQETVETAASLATRAALAGAETCDARIDTSRTRTIPTDPRFVTPARPAGFDVRIEGEEGGPGSFSAGNEFESNWLVTNDGAVHPQDLAAARLISGCGLPPAAPKTPLDWHRMTYIDPGTGEIAIGSPLWSGAVFNRPLLRRDGDVGPLHESHAPIWKFRCKPGRQLATFKREVFLLGPPASLRVGITSAFNALRRLPFRGISRTPFNGISFYLEGRLVARSGGHRLEAKLSKAERKLVRFGANDLKIRVVKERTGPCNASGSPRQLGIRVVVNGRHRFRTTVTRPPPVSQGNPLAPIPYTVTNRGPSVLVGGRFTLGALFRTSSVSVLGPFGSGAGADCTSAMTTYVVACSLRPMKPGTSRKLDVVLAARRSDREIGEPQLVTWQLDYEFSGAKGISGGDYCLPPEGRADCAGMSEDP